MTELIIVQRPLIKDPTELEKAARRVVTEIRETADIARTRPARGKFRACEGKLQP